MQIPKDMYAEIEKSIASEKSVVGIDAKKTHIMILHQLMELNKRMDKLEKMLEQVGERPE